MKPREQYFEAVTRLIRTIYDREEESIRAAATILADQVEKGNLIHVFGSGGHSYIGAEEMTWRSGGLVPVDTIFDPGVSLSFGAVRSTMVERVPGYMPAVLSTYDLKAGEAMVIINAYGINSATIDTALEAKRLGLTVIGITGTEHPRVLEPGHPSRHPSSKNLYELVDVFINTYVPVGDGVVVLDGFSEKVAAVSTICNAFAINLMVAETIDTLVKRGIEPPVWKSANSPGGDERNKRYIEEYRGKIRCL